MVQQTMFNIKLTLTLILIALLAACNPYAVPTPPEDLEPTAIPFPSSNDLFLQPTNINVNQDSQTGLALVVVGPVINAPPVTFTLQNAPSGVTLTTTPTLATANSRHFSGLLSVAADAQVGGFDPIIVATAGHFSKTVTFDLTITPALANPNFEIVVGANDRVVNRNDQTSQTVFISRIKGFSQPVVLSLDTSNTPLAGVSAAPVTVPANGFSGNLVITANATAAPFGQTFQVKAVGTASFVKQDSFNLSITPPSGELDSSFGLGDGIADFGGDHFALQTNDKVILAKAVENGLEVRRLNEDGTLDTSFADGGVNALSSTFSGLVGAKVVDFVVLPNNKMIVAFQTITDSLGLIKLNDNGQPDTTFGDDGAVLISSFVDDLPNFLDRLYTDITVQPDGKILVMAPHKEFGFNGTFIFRVKADGSGVDTSFGKAGKVVIRSIKLAVGLSLGGGEILTQADGKIVVAGTAITGLHNWDATVGRLLANGSEDSSFAGGFNRVNFSNSNEFNNFSAIAIDSVGRVVAGGGFNVPILARYRNDGTLDDSFAGDGKQVLEDNVLGLSSNVGAETIDVLVQNDNKILVLVRPEASTARVLVRLNAAGSLDAGFSGDGKTVVPALGVDFFTGELALDSQGRILVLGPSGVARYMK